MPKNRKRFWYFLCFVLVLSLLSVATPARAADLNYDIKYVIDAQTGLVDETINVYNNLAEGYYYSSPTFSQIPKESSSVKFSGDCEDVRIIDDEFEGTGKWVGQWFAYKYLECQPIGGKFETGETIEYQVSGDCNCTSKWGGIINEDYNIRVYPYDFSMGGNQEANIEQVIHIPSNYYVYNSSVKDLSIKNVVGGLEISFSSRLDSGQSLSEIYGDPLFIDFRRKLDFNNIKILSGKYKDTNIKIEYPSGFEEDANKMLAEIQKILPYYERYGATNFSDLKYYIVENNTYSCNAAGCAWAPLESVNISIESGIDTLYHETCHLTEKPFYNPSWFAEGEATTCELTALKNFGHFKEAEEREKGYYEGSMLPIKVDLQTWVASENISEDINRTNKGYGEAFFLMSEILEKISMPKFYSELRNAPPINITLMDNENYSGFWVNGINNSNTNVFIDIMNDPSISIFIKENGTDGFWLEGLTDPEQFWINAKKEFKNFGNTSSTYLLICKLNETSKTNLIPLFERYGFAEASSCGLFQQLTDKIKERALEDMVAAIKMRDRHNTIVGIITVVILVAFVALMVYLIVRHNKKRKKK